MWMPIFVVDGFSRFVSHTREKCGRGQMECIRFEAKVIGNGLFDLFFSVAAKWSQ